MRNLIGKEMIKFDKHIRTILTLFFFISIGLNSYSKVIKVHQTQYLVYASLMNHIAVNTQWPSSKRTGDFVIGVIGSSPIEVELKKLAASKKIGGRKIVVKKFQSDGDVVGCHMIFVPKAKHSILTAVSNKAKVMNALVVTESASNKDFIFNFVKKDGKPRFEYNKVRAASHGLVVSPSLVNLAIKV